MASPTLLLLPLLLSTVQGERGVPPCLLLCCCRCTSSNRSTSCAFWMASSATLLLLAAAGEAGGLDTGDGAETDAGTATGPSLGAGGGGAAAVGATPLPFTCRSTGGRTTACC